MSTRQNRMPDQLAVGWCGPGFGVADERHEPRLHHLDDLPIEHPAAAELPWFEVRVCESPPRKRLTRPVGRPLVGRRAGQPRTDRGHELIARRDDLPSLEAFAT